jgi:hypothetical protein
VINYDHFRYPPKRWYDRVEHLPQALNLVRELPADMQGLICRHLNDLINYNLHKQRGLGDIRNVGITKILGLYNASYRRRWYDPNPTMRRAFTMMVTIPEDTLSDFAARMVLIGEYVLANRHRLAPTANQPSLIVEVDRWLKDPNPPEIILQAQRDFKLAASSNGPASPVVDPRVNNLTEPSLPPSRPSDDDLSSPGGGGSRARVYRRPPRPGR